MGRGQWLARSRGSNPCCWAKLASSALDDLACPRPDVAAYLSGIPHAAQSGFYDRFSVLGLAPRFKVVVHAIGTDQRVIPLAEIYGEREGSSVPLDSSEQLQPILVTGLARSGTTWLMRLLDAHPSIVVYSCYPYEMHMASYWWQVCRLLTASPNGIGIAHPRPLLVRSRADRP